MPERTEQSPKNPRPDFDLISRPIEENNQTPKKTATKKSLWQRIWYYLWGDYN